MNGKSECRKTISIMPENVAGIQKNKCAGPDKRMVYDSKQKLETNLKHHNSVITCNNKYVRSLEPGKMVP